MRFLGLALVILFSQVSAAWCHLGDLDMDVRSGPDGPVATNRHNLLIFKMRERSELAFCVKTESVETISEDHLADQTALALGLWLNAFEKHGIRKVRIERLSCDSPDLDLLVTFGGTAPGGQEGEMQLSSGYAHVELYARGTHFAPTDTQNLIGNLPLSELLTKIEELQASLFTAAGPYDPTDAGVAIRIQNAGVQFASSLGLDYHRLVRSTFAVLLHELGHAFALAHAQSRVSDYRSTTRPVTAVMAAGGGDGHLVLTPDDVAGVESLAKRVFRPR